MTKTESWWTPTIAAAVPLLRTSARKGPLWHTKTAMEAYSARGPARDPFHKEITRTAPFRIAVRLFVKHIRPRRDVRTRRHRLKGGRKHSWCRPKSLGQYRGLQRPLGPLALERLRGQRRPRGTRVLPRVAPRLSSGRNQRGEKQ